MLPKPPRLLDRYYRNPIDSDGGRTTAQPSQPFVVRKWMSNQGLPASFGPLQTTGNAMDTTSSCRDLSDESTRTYEEEYTSIRIDNANDIDQLLIRHEAVLTQLDALSQRIEGLLAEVASKPAGLLVT
jgi:hypothetical protein